MASDELKQTLLNLHARLAAGEHLDPDMQDLLRLLEADIHARLRQDAATPGTTGGAAFETPSMSSPAAPLLHATAAHSIHPAQPAQPAQTSPVAPTSLSTASFSSTAEPVTDPNDTPPETGLSIRAQEISARFAAAHPHLEPVLRELTDTLQRIGI